MRIIKNKKRKLFLEVVQKFNTGMVTRGFMAKHLREYRKVDSFHVYADYFGRKIVTANMFTPQSSGSLDIQTYGGSGKTRKMSTDGSLDIDNYEFFKLDNNL